MKYLFLIALTILSSTVKANSFSNMSLVGQSELNWMFWKIYDIQLLTPDGEYRNKHYPLALSIRYAREIAAKDLIETTRDEWLRMGLEWQDGWINQLESLWPDVSVNDELLLVVDESGLSHFYHNGNELGRIEDASFTEAFLSIWLSEKTREPEMRKQLMGDPDA